MEKGIALIEVIIVLLIVSVGMAALARLQGDLLWAGATSKARLEALALLQTEAERLRMNPASAVSGRRENIPGSTAFFTVEWSVAAFTATGAIDQYQVQVSWQDRRQISQSVALSFLLHTDPMLDTGAGSHAARAAAACGMFSCPEVAGP